MSVNGTIPGKTLAHFTSPGLIVPQLRGREVASVLQELSQLLQREGRLTDVLPFYQAALNREFLGNTNMVKGMAFPHARLPHLKELSFAFGQSQAPIEWNGKSGASVALVFLLAVPGTDATQYLLLISGLARLARDPDFSLKLQAAKDSFVIYELFREIALRPHPLTPAR